MARPTTTCLAVIAAIVIASLALQAKKQKPTFTADEHHRAQHALDRLTFGPRPGDVDAVMATGVDHWIEQQLHPEKIDDSAMHARLAGYRTLQMSTREMGLAFPPQFVAKAVMEGKLPIPRDTYEHAIYAAAIDRVQQRQAKRENASDAGLQTAGAGDRRTALREAHNDVDGLIALAPDVRMARILALPVAEQHDLLQGIPYPKRQALLAGLAPQQRETVLALNHPEAVVQTEVQSAKLLRATYSERQLEEVLTDFWFNHFNVYIEKGADRYMVTAYERDVIRPHALGKFKDLLLATAQSPAMLFYLDNWQSEGPHSDAALGLPEQKPHPYAARGRFGHAPTPLPQRPQQNRQRKRSGLNENYARELMELQTLGVSGGYTQQDVTEVARVFTGWTLQEPREGGDFVFKPRLHEPGTKTVLGHKIKGNGEKEGVEVLNLLAKQPATARFISTQLAQRFVSDNPPQSLVNVMAKSYLKSDGDIREVLRTMLRSPEFWAPEAYRARVKTPFEFVVSSLRATEAQVDDPLPLLQTLNKMGQPMYGCQPPTGYSTKSEVWVNSAALLDRMNFGLALAANKLPGTTFDVVRLTNASNAPVTADADPYEAQSKLELALLGGNVSKQTHETIEERVVAPEQAAGNGAGPSINVIAGLLLGSPEFQRK